MQFYLGNGLQYNAKLIHTIGITRNQRREDLEFQLFQGGVLTHRPRHFDRLDHQRRPIGWPQRCPAAMTSGGDDGQATGPNHRLGLFNLKSHLKKTWCIRKVDASFLARMEALLWLYDQPH